MNWQMHLAIAAVLALVSAYVLGIRDSTSLALVAVFGGMGGLAPDLDHEMSKGRQILDFLVVGGSFAGLYWVACNRTACVPNMQFFIHWLAVVGGYFLLFKILKPQHRGITHTIVANLVFGAVIWLVFGNVFGVAGLIGYFSHLAGDRELKLV